MHLWIVLIVTFVLFLGVQYWFGKAIFDKRVTKLYFNLHFKLLFARRKESGSYVKVKKYLKAQKLGKDQLEMLQLLIISKMPNVNVDIQIFNTVITSFFTISVLLFGTVFSGFFGGLIGRFIEESFGDHDQNKMNSILENVNNLTESSTLNFALLMLIFFTLVKTWGQYQTRLSEAKIIINKIVEEELNNGC